MCLHGSQNYSILCALLGTVHAACALILQMREQAQRVSIMLQLLHRGWQVVGPRDMCHSLLVWHGHPNWRAHWSLGRKEWAWLSKEALASQKNRDGHSLCRSPERVRKSGLVTRGRQSLRHHRLFYPSKQLSKAQSLDGTLCFGLIS